MHSTKNAPLISENSPSELENKASGLHFRRDHPKSQIQKWFLAARPKTWIASISPVCIGACFSMRSYPLFVITLLFALCIQIGTNFANDYFDFIKKADTHERIGPKRAVQQGWISPASMLQATKIVFGLGFVFAIPLMISVGLWSLGIVLLSIICGILYTGGPKPLGYLGLGEIFVFIFFGPIATFGAYYVQEPLLSIPVLIAGIAPGLFSTALIIANNLRDATTDKVAQKNTLVVRLGTLFGKLEYTFAISIPLTIPCLLIAKYDAPINLFSAACLFPIGVQLIKKAWQAKKGEEYIPLLPGTSFLLTCYTALFMLVFLMS